MSIGTSATFETRGSKWQQENKTISSNQQQLGDTSSSDNKMDPFTNMSAPIQSGSDSTDDESSNANANQFNKKGMNISQKGTLRSNLRSTIRRTQSVRTSRPNAESYFSTGTAANTGSTQSFGNVTENGMPSEPSNDSGTNDIGQTFEYNRFSLKQPNIGLKHSQSTYPLQPSLSPAVETMSDLDSLGKFDCLAHSSPKFQIISKYVNSSHGLKDTQGTFKIHDVYEINKNDWMAHKQSLKVLGEPGSEQLLLWVKTSSRSIQKLAQQNNGCISFYDRLCRALPQNSKNMPQPLRQLMILCAVSVGKVYESPHGFQHWSLKSGVPDGFSTIKGMGKLIPNWEDNEGDDDSIIVPCGRTTENKKIQTYNLEYNEYILFEANRIKVKYAVDLEIIPATNRGKWSQEIRL